MERDGSPAYRFTGLAHLELPPPGSIGPDVTAFHTGSFGIVSRSSADLLDAFAKAGPGALRSLDPNVRLSMEPSVERWRERVAALIKVSEEDVRALFGADADVDPIAGGWLSERCGLVA